MEIYVYFYLVQVKVMRLNSWSQVGCSVTRGLEVHMKVEELRSVTCKWDKWFCLYADTYHWFTSVPIGTVKAPNFGSHGNFGPHFQKGLLSLKRVLQKNEENESCRKTLDLQIWFCLFVVHDSSTEATKLARKSSKIPWRPKLEGFTVPISRISIFITLWTHYVIPAWLIMLKRRKRSSI